MKDASHGSDMQRDAPEDKPDHQTMCNSIVKISAILTGQ